MSLIQSAGFLIFRQTPHWEFLLMRHADRWDLPKGHVDPGETALQTAYRELTEETGISPSSCQREPGFEWRHYYQVPLRADPQCFSPKELVVYLGLLMDSTPIRCTEHQGYAWLSWPPPPRLQAQTIDPLLEAVANYWRQQGVTQPHFRKVNPS